MNHDETEGLRCFKGVIFALPFSLLIWGLVIWAVMAGVKGCHKKPVHEYESVGPLPTNVMIKAEVFELK